ncbi:GGDEF domain-containing protein [uncultured Abyssibacter sp.]|mgnify:CR=1 FL=1|uniref:GGDEF domain-containing protein n=1 Tax=uncultured Abyssibacter sp. TaxID=2320202 RepID=UPI0032B183EE
MQNLSKVKQWRRAVDPAVELAGFDHRTGLAGRELLLQRLDQQWAFCTKQQLNICLLVINIGRFSLVRRQTGAEVDNTLIAVGNLVSLALRRRADFAGHIRVGEFCALLADVQPGGARQVAESIVSSVREARIPLPGAPGETVRVSVGGACFVPTPHHFSKTLLSQADQALDDARGNGGDCAVVFGMNDHPDIAHGGW